MKMSLECIFKSKMSCFNFWQKRKYVMFQRSQGKLETAEPTNQLENCYRFSRKRDCQGFSPEGEASPWQTHSLAGELRASRLRTGLLSLSTSALALIPLGYECRYQTCILFIHSRVNHPCKIVSLGLFSPFSYKTQISREPV